MADNNSIIELYIMREQDITEEQRSEMNVSQHSTSQIPLIVETQPSTSSIEMDNQDTGTETNVSYIQVETHREHKITILWAKDISRNIKFGSCLQLNGEEEIYEVVGIMKRSAKFDTLICMGNRGNTIGLIVNSKRYESSKTEKLYRILILIPNQFIREKVTKISYKIRNAYNRVTLVLRHY